jgi:ribosomal protein L11 methyltransferase
MTESSAPRPVFPFVLVDVAADLADETSSLLFDLGAQGVEERDATTLVKGARGGTTLVASFVDRAAADEAAAALDAALSPRVEEVIGDEWRDEWKKHFEPFVLCADLVVRPPWQPYAGAPVAHVLELEPGRAFGTGLHETTSLVAGLLSERRAELAGRAVLDVGCGSGILALVALTFGAATARAVDNDPEVVPVARENAERNGLGDRLTCDAEPLSSIDEAFPVVVANIEADVLIRLAPALSRAVAPAGLLILSGILLPQAARVLAAYPGFSLESAPERGEWTALALRKT